MRHLTLICVLFSTLVSTIGICQDHHDEIIRGQNIFQTNCGSCHDVHREIIGPALASVTKKKSEEWLISFIKNSQRVIVSGDEYANTLFQKYHYQVMPSFRNLSVQEIKHILAYVESESLIPSTSYSETITCDQTNVLQGKEIFRQQCATCHFIHMEGDFGPALASVTKRHPRQWLFRFIRNSQEVINSGDNYAMNLYKKFDERTMVRMDFLTDDEIQSVLDYIESESAYYPKKVVLAKNIRSDISNGLSESLTDVASQKQGRGWVFKILLIVIAAGFITIHAFLVIRIFNYLEK